MFENIDFDLILSNILFCISGFLFGIFASRRSVFAFRQIGRAHV